MGDSTVMADYKISEDVKTKQNSIFNKNTNMTQDITDNNLLSYYTNKDKYDENEIFDKFYAQALTLMGGDKLLKPIASLNNIIIRKTTTTGLYKLIINDLDGSYFIKMLDESQLLNNRLYCLGTISKLDENEFEITYFDSEDEILIEHFNKQDVIKFMKDNKLVFQN